MPDTPDTPDTRHAAPTPGPKKNVVKELRRVDDSFGMLRPGRELEDKLQQILDADPVELPRTGSPVRALGALGAAAIVVVVLVALRTGEGPPLVAGETVRERSDDALGTGHEGGQGPGDEAASVRVPVPVPVPGPGPAPVAPASRATSEDTTRISVLLPDEVRFVDVPLGRLELRAPAVVDVTDDGVVVVVGTARLLERGNAPRALLAGETIAWKIPDAPPPRRDAPVQPKDTAPRAATALPASPGVTDDEVDAALEEARALQARGSPAAAADLLGDLLARRPAARAADTIAFERAALLVRARDVPDACAAYAEHARSFPQSENAADVAAARARLACP